jgi:hypothetical protein
MKNKNVKNLTNYEYYGKIQSHVKRKGNGK